MKVIDIISNENSIILTVEKTIQYEFVDGKIVGICPSLDYVEISKENLRKMIDNI
jgi:hypothetical protein